MSWVTDILMESTVIEITLNFSAEKTILSTLSSHLQVHIFIFVLLLSIQSRIVALSNTAFTFSVNIWFE